MQLCAGEGFWNGIMGLQPSGLFYRRADKPFIYVLLGYLRDFLIKAVYPAISRFVERIPNRSGPIITWVLVCFMLFNTIISTAAVARWSQRTDGIAPKSPFGEYLDNRYPDDFLKEVYPNMKKVKIQATLLRFPDSI